MNAVSDIAFFLEVVKAGSLSGAAQELGVTTAAVSRRLAQLETRLGIRLLNRTTRRSTVTHEGEVYLEEGKRILGDLEELEQRVSSGQAMPKGLLRVNATFGFGRQFLAPAIAEFMELHPDVEVQLQLTDRPVNLIDDGYDVCIRFGDVPDAHITSKRLPRTGVCYARLQATWSALGYRSLPRTCSVIGASSFAKAMPPTALGIWPLAPRKRPSKSEAPCLPMMVRWRSVGPWRGRAS